MRLVPTGVAVVMATSSVVDASRTAGDLSIVFSGISLWHGLITAVAPNPVTGVTSLIYGGIGLGCAIYDRCVDPLPMGAPVIQSVHAGPPAGRISEPYELIPAGPPIGEAPAGRMLTISGDNFSFTQSEMQVLFDGVQAATGPISTNHHVVTAVPLSGLGTLPRTVSLMVVVNGIQSAPFPFTVTPPPPAGNAADRVRGKLSQLASLTATFDWAGLIDIEAPGLPPEDRQCALSGADDMVDGSNDVMPHLVQFQNELNTNPQFRTANEQFLAANPEMERGIDAGIVELGRSVPAASYWTIAALTVGLIGAASIFILRRFGGMAPV